MTAQKPPLNTARSRATWKRSLTGLFICSGALMTVACTHLEARSDPPAIPANLQTPCQNLDDLSNGTGGAVLSWAIGTVRQYQDCQAKHARLLAAWPK